MLEYAGEKVFEDILKKVCEHQLSPEEAIEQLKDYPYQDLEFAKIDHHRELRKGVPEIIYGVGKTGPQILKIAREIIRKGGNLLITRVEPEVYRALKGKIPGAVYNPAARTITMKQKEAAAGQGEDRGHDCGDFGHPRGRGSLRHLRYPGERNRAGL